MCEERLEEMKKFPSQEEDINKGMGGLIFINLTYI